MTECPNASELNFALTQCDSQFHYNLWVIRAHHIRTFASELIRPCSHGFRPQARPVGEIEKAAAKRAISKPLGGRASSSNRR